MKITKEFIQKELIELNKLKNKIADNYNKTLGAIEAYHKLIVIFDTKEKEKT